MSCLGGATYGYHEEFKESCHKFERHYRCYIVYENRKTKSHVSLKLIITEEFPSVFSFIRYEWRRSY